MAEYNKLTIYLGNKGILYEPIEYLKSHVIVYLDTSMLPPSYKPTIDKHFNSIVPIIMKIINNLVKLKNNDINAIGTIKLNIKEYKKLKEQFKKTIQVMCIFLKKHIKILSRLIKVSKWYFPPMPNPNTPNTVMNLEAVRRVYR